MIRCVSSRVINRSIGIIPFKVIHGYKPRKPLDLLPMSIHARVSESTKYFAQKIHDLRTEITKHIQVSNAQYKLRADLYKRHNEFNMGDYVMIRIRPERFPSGVNRKWHASSVGPFKVLQRVGPNAYVFNLPYDFDISSAFNIKDLAAYHKSLPISNNPFEMPLNPLFNDPIEIFIPFTLTSAQKDNINVILDEQVVLNRNGEVQWFLVIKITRDTLQHLEPDLWECYQSQSTLHSTGSSFSNPGRVGGDTRPTSRVTQNMVEDDAG